MPVQTYMAKKAHTRPWWRWPGEVVLIMHDNYNEMIDGFRAERKRADAAEARVAAIHKLVDTAEAALVAEYKRRCALEAVSIAMREVIDATGAIAAAELELAAAVEAALATCDILLDATEQVALVVERKRGDAVVAARGAEYERTLAALAELTLVTEQIKKASRGGIEAPGNFMGE